MSRVPIIDCHVHLVADGVAGCFLSSRLRNGIIFRFLRRKIGRIEDGKGRGLSEAYLIRLLEQLDVTQGLDALVLLAMDARYDASGKLDRQTTALYVSNEYCFEMCRRDPRLLPGASVNPRRADAFDELERVAHEGAVCVKVMPNTQDFDPSNPAFRPFWRRMAELGLPLLAHTGREYTLPVTQQTFGDPHHLAPVLDEGVTVIAAHAGGAGIFAWRETFDDFIDMLDPYPNLYGDISSLSSLGRAKYFPRVLARQDVHGRLIYGSDYPVPASPMRFTPRIGLRRAWDIARNESLLGAPLAIARALEVPEEVFQKASDLLRLDRHAKLIDAAWKRPNVGLDDAPT